MGSHNCIMVLLIATFSVRRRPVACQRLIDRVIRLSLVIVVSAILLGVSMFPCKVEHVMSTTKIRFDTKNPVRTSKGFGRSVRRAVWGSAAAPDQRRLSASIAEGLRRWVRSSSFTRAVMVLRIRSDALPNFTWLWGPLAGQKISFQACSKNESMPDGHYGHICAPGC